MSLGFITFLSTNPVFKNFLEINSDKSVIDSLPEHKLIFYCLSDEKIYVRSYVINIIEPHNKTFIAVDSTIFPVIQNNLLRFVLEIPKLATNFTSLLGISPLGNNINNNQNTSPCIPILPLPIFKSKKSDEEKHNT